MMRFCLLFLSFVWLNSYAQTDSVQYFDAQDKRTHNNAVYYRKISKPDTGQIYLATDYWINGHIKMVGYTLDTSCIYKIGRFTYYYTNGIKSGEGQFYSDLNQHVCSYKNKKWETWYPTGKPKEVWIYKIADDFTFDESFLMNFWDTAQNELTVKGEGRYDFTDRIKTKDSLQKVVFSGPVHKGLFERQWNAYYPNGKEYAEEQYVGGKFVNGKSFDGAGNAYSYDSLETDARFPGGQEGLEKFLELNIHQPRVTNRGAGFMSVAKTGNDAMLSNTVYVRIFVGRTGFIGNVNIIRSAENAEMDGEAIRVAKLMPRFSPATVRGQPVDSYVIIPIPFRQP
jgi:protein TonB